MTVPSSRSTASVWAAGGAPAHDLKVRHQLAQRARQAAPAAARRPACERPTFLLTLRWAAWCCHAQGSACGAPLCRAGTVRAPLRRRRRAAKVARQPTGARAAACGQVRGHVRAARRRSSRPRAAAAATGHPQRPGP